MGKWSRHCFIDNGFEIIQNNKVFPILRKLQLQDIA